jgi:hypothetical protein
VFHRQCQSMKDKYQSMNFIAFAATASFDSLTSGIQRASSSFDSLTSVNKSRIYPNDTRSQVCNTEGINVLFQGNRQQLMN